MKFIDYMKKIIKSRTKKQILSAQEKSAYYTDSKIRDSIDGLLEKNAKLESSLGIDSTMKEKIKVKVKQQFLFNKIRKLDKEFWKIIVIKGD